MKKILLILLAICSLSFSKAFSQGIIFTKAGDTIYYTKLEHKYPNTLYWIEGSSKPIKIKLTDISNTVQYPEYALSTNEVDEFTGSKKIMTHFITVGSTKSGIMAYSVNLISWVGKMVNKEQISYYIMFRSPAELGCSGSDKNYAYIKFANDEVLKLEKDIAEIDCKKNAVSIYMLDEFSIDKLRHNEIKAIRFKQSDSYEDYYTMFPDCIIKSVLLLDQ